MSEPLKRCPGCDIPWERKETIYEHFLNHYRNHGVPNTYGDISVEDAAKLVAEDYGCTPDTPKHFGVNVYGLEVPGYDGVSFWVCDKCNTHIDRFTGIIVPPMRKELD